VQLFHQFANTVLNFVTVFIKLYGFLLQKIRELTLESMLEFQQLIDALQGTSNQNH